MPLSSVLTISWLLQLHNSYNSWNMMAVSLEDILLSFFVSYSSLNLLTVHVGTVSSREDDSRKLRVHIGGVAAVRKWQRWPQKNREHKIGYEYVIPQCGNDATGGGGGAEFETARFSGSRASARIIHSRIFCVLDFCRYGCRCHATTAHQVWRHTVTTNCRLPVPSAT